MKKTCVVLGVMLALALVLAGMAQARMWVGIQGGVNVLGNTDADFSNSFGSMTVKDIRFDNPTAIGGVTVGYDFVKEGFLGYSYPEWMKYFSFAVDFTFNLFQIPNHHIDFIEEFKNNGDTGEINGKMACLSFLFMAKYGFFPDSEVPFGRLQPYVAVGPGVLFNSIRTGPFGSTSWVDVALVTEGGVRYMALKNVSLDASFRYRFARPDFDIDTTNAFGSKTNVKVDLNSFTALFRVSYHF